jgi:hypothetical protein
LKQVLALSTVLVKTVANLDGDSSMLRCPEKRIEANKPKCLLPRDVFESHAWIALGAGRWRSSDHITLGEARAVVKLLDGVILSKAGFRIPMCSLQDNQPVSGASHKGRSPSPSLNYVLRRKASRTLAFAIRLVLPWVETTLQPADWLSRARELANHLWCRRC